MIRFTPPPEVHLGPLTLNSHGLFFLLGALAAYFWTRARLPEKYHAHVDYAASWMTLGGVVGARLLYVALNPSMVRNPLDVFALWQGGLVSYGGLFGALIAWAIYVKVNRLPAALLNDAMGPPGLLGWGIGRIGCFLNWYNEFGTPTDVPWAIIAPVAPGGPDDVPRHPVMLYLAVFNILAAVAAALLARRLNLRADGLALMGYGLVRLIFDTWRDYDPAWLHQGSAGVSIFLFLVGLVIVVKGRVPTREVGSQ